VRYRAAATYHAGAQSAPATLASLQVVSNESMVDGQLRNKGYFSDILKLGTNTMLDDTGDGRALPQNTASGSLPLDTSGAQAFYQVPVTITIDPDVKHDVAIVIAINAFASVRWFDQESPVNVRNVLDANSQAHEPVRHFGVASLGITLE
jgi:hypothetical protein